MREHAPYVIFINKERAPGLPDLYLNTIADLIVFPLNGSNQQQRRYGSDPYPKQDGKHLPYFYSAYGHLFICFFN